MTKPNTQVFGYGGKFQTDIINVLVITDALVLSIKRRHTAFLDIQGELIFYTFTPEEFRSNFFTVNVGFTSRCRR